MKAITKIEKIICLLVLIFSYSIFSWSINIIPSAGNTERRNTDEITKTVETADRNQETGSEENIIQEDTKESAEDSSAVISYPKPEIEKFVGNEFLGEITVDGITFAVYDNGAEVTDAYKRDGNIVIPETVEYAGESYEVKAIGNEVLSYDPFVRSLIIPDTVTTVGYCSIKECKFLISIYISENLTYIDFGSFSGNGGAQIFIPPSVYEIGSEVFERNYGEAVITSHSQYQYLLQQSPYMEARVEENVSQQEVYDAHLEEYERSIDK